MSKASLFLFATAIALGVSSGVQILDSKTLNAINKHPDGALGSLRLFHPAFPTALLNPISSEHAQDLSKLKRTIGTLDNVIIANEDMKKKGLPWKILPEIGISDFQNLMSKKDIAESFERYRHQGHIVWAHKLEKIEEGCVLLNHWKQEAILITQYKPSRGARGIRLLPSNQGREQVYEWAPITLEVELRERKWQAVAVSDNISSGEILSLLPPMMTKSPWELIFLLLLSKNDVEARQALLDTGLSPRQGLIAYIRLLKQVELRTEAWDGVPSHRLISERDVEL